MRPHEDIGLKEELLPKVAREGNIDINIQGLFCKANEAQNPIKMVQLPISMARLPGHCRMGVGYTTMHAQPNRGRQPQRTL